MVILFAPTIFTSEKAGPLFHSPVLESFLALDAPILLAMLFYALST